MAKTANWSYNYHHPLPQNFTKLEAFSAFRSEVSVNRMGQGRPAQSPEIKIATGTWSGSKAAVARELMNDRPATRPAFPPHLAEYHDDAEEYWERFCDMIEEHSLPFACCEISLELLVTAYCDYRDTLKANKGRLPIQRQASGGTKPSSLYVVLDNLRDRVERLAMGLGLTVLGRATVFSRVVDALSGSGARDNPHASSSLPSRQR